MGVIDEMKDVADLIKKAGDVELYRKIVKLEGEVIDLTRNKRRAEEKIVELEQALKFTRDLQFREPFYWIEGDNVPYCPRCWEEKRLAIHIVYKDRNNYGEWWDCKSCAAQFNTHGLRAH